MMERVVLGVVLLVAATGCQAQSVVKAPAVDGAQTGLWRASPAFHDAGGFRAAELARLRAQGPTGVATIASALDRAGGDLAKTTGLRDALDQVAQQKDAFASRLYWYTDLDEAKRAARASGKPILSLRLLGNLTDELSCANSRFFRTVLYPNAQVNRALAGRYILHWSSERPAPVITIDFGDGRRVTRTVTGNSIHYLLDADGRPLDAMPGLVGPQAFAKWLATTDQLRDAIAARGYEAAMHGHHETQLALLEGRFRQELVRAGLPPLPWIVRTQPRAMPRAARPPAMMAMPIAPSKAAVEGPTLGGFAPSVAPPPIESIPWAKLAPFHAADVEIDRAGRAMLHEKSPRDWTEPTHPRPLDDVAFETLVTHFEGTLAEDTAKNELALHATIHAWLADTPSMSLDDLNGSVYATLFLTPRSDPWLGLMPAGVFTGIQDDGLVR